MEKEEIKNPLDESEDDYEDLDEFEEETSSEEGSEEEEKVKENTSSENNDDDVDELFKVNPLRAIWEKSREIESRLSVLEDTLEGLLEEDEED